MTTDAAILGQLRAAWNRSAEEPPTEGPSGTSTGQSRSDRQDTDRLVRDTLERINAACPPDWKPSAEDWQRIDRAEGTIDRARRENDRPELLAALADYESVAVDIFAESTSTPPTVAMDDALTGTLLGLFDGPPDEQTPEPLLSCFARHGHRAAWRSIHGAGWICAICHPPARSEIVAETAELNADGQIVGRHPVGT